MQFTQWVVEWAIDNGPNAPLVWGPVIVNRRSHRPKMHDSKTDAERTVQLSRMKGVKYRVRKVNFWEIAQ